MKHKRLVPFWLMPASWGLKGKSRLVAEAEYYNDGDDLDLRLAEINADTPLEADLVKLDVKLKSKKITQQQYDRERADLLNEPFVTVVRMGVNPNMVSSGYFELDWNDQFVRMLEDAGVVGKSDEDIVNKWFNSVCKSILLQGNADLDFGLKKISDTDDDNE